MHEIEDVTKPSIIDLIIYFLFLSKPMYFDDRIFHVTEQIEIKMTKTLNFFINGIIQKEKKINDNVGCQRVVVLTARFRSIV